MKKAVWFKISAVLLAVVILCASMPLVFAEEETTIHIGVFSDVHYYPNALKGNNCDAYKNFTYLSGKEYTENNALLDNALLGVEAILSQAEEEGAEYLLIPGDMTKDGELEGHQELAEKLEAWQARTGIPVFVTNGNHDVNNPNATSFADGTQKKGNMTSPEQFREIYKNLGFDKADATYTPANYPEEKGGMLSYAADLGDAYRLIVVDSCMYSEDNGAENNEKLTDGRVGEPLLNWVKDQAAQAEKDGKTVLLMQHHNLVPHMDIEEATFFAFVLQDWEQVADAYADAGIHYIFSGHLHASDTSSYVSDNGERITDILSPTLTGYPNFFRGVDVTTDGKDTTLNMTNYDIDDESLGLPQITSELGETYDRPYRLTQSFEQTFGNNIGDYLERIFKKLIDTYFAEIQQAGGIIPFLKTMGLDVEQLLVGLIGTNGISVAGTDILTVRTNAMGLINDIDKQIMEHYISDPEGTLATLMEYINRLLNIKVSDYPATLNKELLGVDINEDGCTFGEFATTALLLYYGGDEDVYGKAGYEYIKDTLDSFESGELTETVFTTLIDTVLGLAKDEILANIDLNPGSIFPDGTVFSLLGKLLQAITVKAFGGNNSLTNIVETILGLDVVPDKYGSIEDILNTLLLNKYLTDNQYEAWGITISWMIKSLVFDENPDVAQDNNITITYSGKEDVDVSKETYRLPNDVVMTLGDDSSTSVTISWITKYSITDSDIELIPYSASPSFTGKATKGEGITSEYEIEKLSYPGADLGVFSFLPYYRDFVKHTVTLTGLTPGEKYSYRVGSAERGWWSDAGVITTAGDGAFTFINITDPHAQNPKHYEAYGEVMAAAKELYPDAAFTVSNGDQVDAGANMKHWSSFFNSSDTFMSMPFMPTSGNLEKKGAVLNNYFNLPNVPDQDEETGTYYSYDYNNVHFTVLNTNDLEDDKLSKAQLSWLENDVRNSDADWHIVVLHKALYANGSYYDDDETVGLRNQLSALLPYLGVDLVLEGHNHVYTRTDVMNSNCVVPTETTTEEYNGSSYEMKLNPSGTVYSVICSAGVKDYAEISTSETNKSFPEAESIMGDEYPMFSAITVDGNSLYYDAYQVIDGKAVKADSFGIKKNADAQSPAEKLGDNFLSRIISSILSSLNVKITWKLQNFIMKLLAPLIKALGSIK